MDDRQLILRLRQALVAACEWHTVTAQLTELAVATLGRPGGGCPDWIAKALLQKLPEAERFKARMKTITGEVAPMLRQVDEDSELGIWVGRQLGVIHAVSKATYELAEVLVERSGQWQVDGAFEDMIAANYGQEGMG